MPRTSVVVSLAVIGALVLSACQPTDTATTPPPSLLTTTATSGTPPKSAPATTSVTPSPSTPLITARPTTPEQTAALAAEAEAVYREYKKLLLTYEAKGGVDGPLPEPLKKYVAGEAAATLDSILRKTFEAGGKLEGVELYQVTRVSDFMNELEPTAIIGVEFCDDGSRVTVVTRQGARSAGRSFKSWSEFARGTDGRLRIIYNESKEIASCDS